MEIVVRDEQLQNGRRNFVQQIIYLLGISVQQAENVADLAQKHLLPEQNHQSIRPGQILFEAVSAHESPFKPRKYCQTIQVTLTLTTEDDIVVRQSQASNGVIKVRQRQIIRMANEAALQGGLLSLDDFAYRIINCGLRTLQRDVKAIAEAGIHLSLRSS